MFRSVINRLWDLRRFHIDGSYDTWKCYWLLKLDKLQVQNRQHSTMGISVLKKLNEIQWKLVTPTKSYLYDIFNAQEILHNSFIIQRQIEWMTPPPHLNDIHHYKVYPQHVALVYQRSIFQYVSLCRVVVAKWLARRTPKRNIHKFIVFSPM